MIRQSHTQRTRLPARSLLKENSTYADLWSSDEDCAIHENDRHLRMNLPDLPTARPPIDSNHHHHGKPSMAQSFFHYSRHERNGIREGDYHSSYSSSRGPSPLKRTKYSFDHHHEEPPPLLPSDESKRTKQWTGLNVQESSSPPNNYSFSPVNSGNMRPLATSYFGNNYDPHNPDDCIINNNNYYHTAADPRPQQPEEQTNDRKNMMAWHHQHSGKVQPNSAECFHKLQMFDETGAPFILGLSSDRSILSEALCLVRENVQVFTATEEDIKAKAPGRKNTIVQGQVGIRCIHCIGRSLESRVKRAQCYPTSIARIYRTVTDMKLDHFPACPWVPDCIKKKLIQLKVVNTRSNSTTMRYFKESAELLGMIDTENGIHFGNNSSNPTKLSLLLNNRPPTISVASADQVSCEASSTTTSDVDDDNERSFFSNKRNNNMIYPLISTKVSEDDFATCIRSSRSKSTSPLTIDHVPTAPTDNEVMMTAIFLTNVREGRGFGSVQQQENTNTNYNTQQKHDDDDCSAGLSESSSLSDSYLKKITLDTAANIKAEVVEI